MITSYFTLGQSHIYRLNGQTLDRDCVIKITAENPRGVYNLTDNKWE